jgi:lipoate-protein ligase A
VQKGCFATVSQHEIIVGRQKIAAGSQRRTRQALLQHGAIRMAPPQSHPAIVDLLQSKESEQLPEVTERREDLVQILSRAFEMTFGVRMESGPFSRSEKTVISDRLEEFKNMNPQ